MVDNQLQYDKINHDSSLATQEQHSIMNDYTAEDSCHKTASSFKIIIEKAAYFPAKSLAKRIFDLVAGGLLLVGLTPIMLVVASLVKHDGGPILFRHNRIGANGKHFNCLKFRTMCPDAEIRLENLLASDPDARQAWERDFKLRVDPRVTPLGRILRDTSLDELPQIINVIRGDMSLVGPRPIVPEEAQRYGHAFHDYLNCRPGLTGVWQVSGRNDVDYKTRVRMDSEYSRNWSLLKDIYILIKTISVVVRRTGAY